MPFDPQKIAEDILERVQNPPAVHPWHPGEFIKLLHVTKSHFGPRAVLDAPKVKKPEVERKTVGDAIEWLNSRTRLHPEVTRIDLYLEKQTAHEKAVKHKEGLQKEALETSKLDPRNKSVQDQQASYYKWVAENNRGLNAAVQTTHMDWVTTANKAEVEYHLALVDLDLNKAIKKVLESQVNFLLRLLFRQRLLIVFPFTGGPYVGVRRALCIICIPVYHFVTWFWRERNWLSEC